MWYNSNLLHAYPDNWRFVTFERNKAKIILIIPEIQYDKYVNEKSTKSENVK